MGSNDTFNNFRKGEENTDRVKYSCSIIKITGRLRNWTDHRSFSWFWKIAEFKYKVCKFGNINDTVKR